MRELVVGTFLTLDGVMQAPGGPDEDREGGFQHGGWLVPFFDERFVEIMAGWTTRAGAFLLGRKTYETSRAPGPMPPTRPTRRPRRSTIGRSTSHRGPSSGSTGTSRILLEGDIPVEVSRLKAQDGGEIQVHGSGELVQTLLQHDLVDRFRIWTFPVILGSGKRLFGEGINPTESPARRDRGDRDRRCAARLRTHR